MDVTLKRILHQTNLNVIKSPYHMFYIYLLNDNTQFCLYWLLEPNSNKNELYMLGAYWFHFIYYLKITSHLKNTHDIASTNKFKNHSRHHKIRTYWLVWKVSFEMGIPVARIIFHCNENVVWLVIVSIFWTNNSYWNPKHNYLYTYW